MSVFSNIHRDGDNPAQTVAKLCDTIAIQQKEIEKLRELDHVQVAKDVAEMTDYLLYEVWQSLTGEESEIKKRAPKRILELVSRYRKGI